MAVEVYKNKVLIAKLWNLAVMEGGTRRSLKLGHRFELDMDENLGRLRRITEEVEDEMGEADEADQREEKEVKILSCSFCPTLLVKICPQFLTSHNDGTV